MRYMLDDGETMQRVWENGGYILVTGGDKSTGVPVLVATDCTDSRRTLLPMEWADAAEASA